MEGTGGGRGGGDSQGQGDAGGRGPALLDLPLELDSHAPSWGSSIQIVAVLERRAHPLGQRLPVVDEEVLVYFFPLSVLRSAAFCCPRG